MKLLANGNGSARLAEHKTWEFSPGDNELLSSPVGKAVVSAIRNNSKDESALVHPVMNLEIDLGLDSLARAETFAALENAFSTEFNAEEATTALTVADVIELVRKHGGSDESVVAVDFNWGQIVENADASNVPEIEPILRKRPVFGVFAWSVYRCFNFVCRLLFRLEVEGLENLLSMRSKNDGGQNAFLVCPNHQSFFDPFVVCSTYPLSYFRDTFHVGASEFWEGGIMTWLARLLQVVPVNPDTELMRAMRAGAAGLKKGKILHIYPEGERGFDGDLHEFKKGAAILATELELPIVPVALDGLYKVWPRRSWRIRLAKVKVRFGKPFYALEVLPNERDLTQAEQYTVVIDHLKETIAHMIEEMRSE
jgi:acyl carrier protein